MSTFEVACEHCQSRYQIPISLRDALRGRSVPCAWCTREWTPLPLERHDPRARSGADSLGQPPFPLHPYLQASIYSPPAAPATVESPVARSTTQLLRVGATTSTLSLRIAASGPEFELKAIYDLGARSFFIGHHGCHLELPKASALPDRAIRIRAAEGGFEFEGLDGFLVPVGANWVAKGRIELDARLDLFLSPYRIAMKASSTPGVSILDLEAASGPPPIPSPYAEPPPRAPAAPPAVADMSQTVRDFSAIGLEARKYSDPLGNLDVGLVHLDPPLQGDTAWIKKSPAVIGRTSGDIVLADARVSGKHAQIDILGIDQYSIKDLASTNGTTVNDRPASTTRLQDGDVIGFGGVRLQFLARPKRR